MRRRAAIIAALALTVTGAACFRGDRRVMENTVSDSVPIALGPGDLQIANPDSSMELGLAGDHVFMRFGERIRRQLERDLDTANVRSGGGIGAAIERRVKQGVRTALNRRLEYPLADIDSVSYDGETIIFHYRHRHGMTFENMKNDNRPTLSSFSADDARRFVGAVNARKAATPAG